MRKQSHKVFSLQLPSPKARPQDRAAVTCVIMKMTPISLLESGADVVDGSVHDKSVNLRFVLPNLLSLFLLQGDYLTEAPLFGIGNTSRDAINQGGEIGGRLIGCPICY